MDDQAQTLNRLIKKLSAVRVTLNNDERAILDKMVTGATIEVKTHAMADKAQLASQDASSAAKAEVVSHAMADKIQPASQDAASMAKAEVVSHAMADKIQPASQDASSAAKAEVAAHAMADKSQTAVQDAASAAKQMAKTAKVSYKIYFDEKADAYKLAE